MKNFLKAMLLMLFILLTVTSCDLKELKENNSKKTSNKRTTEVEECDHNYKSEITTKATCVKEGVKNFTCSICNDSYTKKIPATEEHSYKSTITTKATYNKEGVKTFTCTLCDDSYTEAIPATGEETYTKLKNYITSNGKYDSTDQSYEITLGTDSLDNGWECTRIASYDKDEDQIVLVLKIEESYIVIISITEIDGVYGWGYIDNDGNMMLGTNLVANTFNASTSLIYSDHNINDSSLRNSIKSLTSSMLDLLCTYMDEDLARLGLEAEDLGFNNY